jgi:hypothetical protein
MSNKSTAIFVTAITAAVLSTGASAADKKALVGSTLEPTASSLQRSTANGIIGTGADGDGIIGTGADGAGIIGTGADGAGIIGTGAAAEGIIGTGAIEPMGIIGTG